MAVGSLRLLNARIERLANRGIKSHCLCRFSANDSGLGRLVRAAVERREAAKETSEHKTSRIKRDLCTSFSLSATFFFARRTGLFCTKTLCDRYLSDIVIFFAVGPHYPEAISVETERIGSV